MEIEFARAGEVFAGVTATVEDRRQNYGELRFITVGVLDNCGLETARKVRRITSMRKANEREITHYSPILG